MGNFVSNFETNYLIVSNYLLPSLCPYNGFFSLSNLVNFNSSNLIVIYFDYILIGLNLQVGLFYYINNKII